jgi:hypothetical protein
MGIKEIMMKKTSSYSSTISVSDKEKARIEGALAVGNDEYITLNLPIGTVVIKLSDLHNFHRVTLSKTDKEGYERSRVSTYWIAHFEVPPGTYISKKGCKTKVYSPEELAAKQVEMMHEDQR